MTSKGYTFTPENYTGSSTGKSYTFTPENAVGKGYTPDEEDGFWKNAARTALQIPQGIAEATGPGIAAGLFQLGAMGESDLDIDTWHKLRELAEQEGGQFDEEGYEQARQEMLGMIPTVSNIASKIEKETGLPLEPKTTSQKALRLGSTAAKFQPGTAGQKLTAGVAAPVISQGAQSAGLPEVFADPLGLGLAIPAGSKGPKFDIGKSKKPSGLVERQFEGISKPTELPQEKIQKINDKLERDFKSISEDIIKESPIGETAENLTKDPGYKQASRELLNQAQEIADTTPGTIPSKSIKKELADLTSKNVKGYALGEYDKSYLKYMKESLEDIVGENVTHGQLVEQYRKNNKSLGEYFEPGSSKALNRAKKDALLDQNRAIANVLEKSNPELSAVFKDGNQRWTKIMDAEAVDGFINEIFPENGKVNYKKMHDLFDKNGYDRIFKRALGEEGYKAFEQLTKDMLTSEAPYKMLRVAKEKGWGDLYKTGSAFILHPTAGKIKLGLDAIKFGYRSIVNHMLDKPKFALNWKKSINDLKKGDFKAAEKGFKAMEAEVEVLPKEQKLISQKKPETIEIKTEKVQPSKESPKVEKPKAENIKQEQVVPDLGNMAKGMMYNFYEGIFNSLKEGKDTFAGVKDNLLQAAKPAYEAGQIKSVEDLRKFADFWQKSLEKPKQLEAPKKQVEHKEAEMPTNKELNIETPQEDLDFRDRFMAKKDLGQSERLDSMGKNAKPKEKAAEKGLSVGETIKEMDRRYPGKESLLDFKKSLVKEHKGLKIGIKEDGKDLILSTFLLPENSQGKGTGTKILKQITDYADANKKTIYLSPKSSSFKAADDLRLKKFYERNGFKENKNRHKDGYPKELMVRKPENKIEKKYEIKPEAKEKTKLDYFGDITRLEYAKDELKWKTPPQKFKDKKKFLQDQKKELEIFDEKIQSIRDQIENKFGKSTASLSETKVKEVKRQDISKKGLKEQKNWLIEQLDKAIEKAPEGHEDFGKKISKYDNNQSYDKALKKRSEPYELLTFEIPGDGTMKIRNNKKALEQFRNSVDKKWPDKPLKLSKKELQQ